MRKNRQHYIIGTGLLLLLGLCACGNSGNTAASADKSEVGYAENVSQDVGLPMNTEQAVEDTSAASGEAQVSQIPDTEQKLIRYQDYTIETTEFDAFVQSVEQLVTKTQGYVEYSEISQDASQSYAEGKRYASYTLRIPAENLDSFQKEIREIGTVVNQSERVEDVTLNYVDVESHIAALKTEQESLLKMLEQADSIESVLAIQNQLTQVRYQLESYESQKKTYDNDITYSTVSIYLREVDRESKTSATYGGKLMEQLSNNLYGIKNGFLSISLWFLGALPYWILLALLAVLLRLVYKKTVKRKREKKAANQEPIGKEEKRTEAETKESEKAEEEGENS